MRACVNCEGPGEDCFDPERNPALKREIKAARRALVPDNYIKRTIQFARQGYTDIEFPSMTPTGIRRPTSRSPARTRTIRSASRRLPQAVEADGDWELKARTPARRSRPSRPAICGRRSATPPGPRPIPASSSTPPSTTGTPARPRRPIRASNPCSEYMFLDDTACNLASLNLLRSSTATTGTFDVAAYEHAVPAVDVVLEISVLMAQFPSRADRRALLPLPHARPRLRQYRRPADDLRHPLRLASRPGALRRAHRDHDRRRLCDLGRDGRRARPLPRLSSRTASHAAGHPQPSPRRPWRGRGL